MHQNIVDALLLHDLLLRSTRSTQSQMAPRPDAEFKDTEFMDRYYVLLEHFFRIVQSSVQEGKLLEGLRMALGDGAGGGSREVA